MPTRAGSSAFLGDSTQAGSSMDSVQVQILENITTLRREWKWAAFSQFFYTFAPMFNMSDVTLTDIEDDLTRSTNIVLPRIMHRLLYTLTQDRKVSLETWQTILRKQYYRRNPELNPIGPELEVTPGSDDEEGSPPPGSHTSHDVTNGGPSPHGTTPDLAESETGNRTSIDEDAGPSKDSPAEESRDWLTLTMLEKLSSMHLLVEWQFHNPTRLRNIMKDDDEEAFWRIEPVGYDSKTNAYWLIGADRLWIQRAFPQTNRNRKRKRGGAADKTPKSRGANKRSEPVKRSGHRPTRNAPEPAATGGRSRSAKALAKKKLAHQAKELAEFQHQQNKSSKVDHMPFGTRASARLRGAPDDEVWQPIPDEWLASSNGNTKSQDGTARTGLEDDGSISDLTELSEDDNEEDEEDEEDDDDDDGEDEDEEDKISRHESPPPAEADADSETGVSDNFIEWETICVSLHEWEHIAGRWANSTHYAEKAFYKRLVKEIVPVITEELREIQRKKEREEAVVHRKRSSRIAVKESVLEEQRLAAKKKLDEQESMTRSQRLEARLQKEEMELQRKETARAQRQREREEREEREALKMSEDASRDVSVDVEVVEDRPTKKSRPRGILRTNGSSRSSTSHQPSRNRVSEDWELDCEVCHRRGMNQDEGVPMMSCGNCSKWQHIACHDRADHLAGRRKRNWETEDFLCQQCQNSRIPPSGRNNSQHGSQDRSGRHHTYQARQLYSNGTTLPQYGNDMLYHNGGSFAALPQYHRGTLPGIESMGLHHSNPPLHHSNPALTHHNSHSPSLHNAPQHPMQHHPGPYGHYQAPQRVYPQPLHAAPSPVVHPEQFQRPLDQPVPYQYVTYHDAQGGPRTIQHRDQHQHNNQWNNGHDPSNIPGIIHGATAPSFMTVADPQLPQPHWHTNHLRPNDPRLHNGTSYQ